MENEVWAAAHRFRAALDQGGLLYAGFKRFPRGACGDASELLGEYLQYCGFGEWTYCSGVSHSRDGVFDSTHGWLEQRGLIVDITADQFATGRPSVVVTRDPSWHGRFQRMAGMRRAGLDYYGSEAGYDALRADYATLKVRADKVS